MQSKAELKTSSVIRECALRHNAERLFEEVEALDAQEVAIDFSGCDTMTRSFAQEYVRQKSTTKKHITETHLSEDARRMLQMVRASRKGERFDFSKWKEEAFPSC